MISSRSAARYKLIRQSFVCMALRNPEFHNLIDSTWALIGHELTATEDPSKGMFSDDSIRSWPRLEDRIRVFKAIGLESSGR